MTDARLPGPWINMMLYADLSDPAWRVFTGSLMWCNNNGTDGLFPERHLNRLHPEGSVPEAFDELEQAGLWVREADGYQLVDWAGAMGQSTAAEVAAYKKNGAARAAAYRQRLKEKLEKKGAGVTRNVTRDERAHVGRGEGEGEGEGEDHSGVTADARVIDWPTRVPGEERSA